VKEICINCRWHSVSKFDDDIHYCSHTNLHKEIKSTTTTGREINYTKDYVEIDYDFIFARETPPWCPGFEKIPEKMPKEMADKIFGKEVE
jgi:hypothetical protein